MKWKRAGGNTKRKKGLITALEVRILQRCRHVSGEKMVPDTSLSEQQAGLKTLHRLSLQANRSGIASI